MLKTQRLRLIPVDPNLAKAALAGDDALAAHLQVSVEPRWTGFGREPFRYVLMKLHADPTEAGWWTYLPVLQGENRLIGSGGYKGKPDEDGLVEIGYEIAPTYRGCGLATEFARGLIDHVLAMPDIKAVQAHTLAEENASTAVLRKCGLQFAGEINLGENGRLWRWRLKKVEMGAEEPKVESRVGEREESIE